MSFSYPDILSYSSQLSQGLDNSDHQTAFDNFQKKWHSIDNVNLLLNEDVFKNRVISLNVNFSNNMLVHDFIMNKAKDFFKDDYKTFQQNINTVIFNGAISLNNLENIRKYTPESLNTEEWLKMSIKYGSWDAFNYFIEEYIPKKQHSKIIDWSHREFWSYHHSGYGSTDFLKNLVTHPLSKNKPLKQDIYTMLDNFEFSFILNLMTDENTFCLFKEINVDHYYKLLLKNLILKKEEPSEYNEGIQLLITSKQSIDFDFSKIKLLPKFKKNYPDISQLIEKFILKDKLDLLPEKDISKTYKI